MITFEDSGIGMDDEIIRRHFLQVGRSYYTTPEFRRRYSFIPTSRFGIGFLSVFNVSSHVTVETLRLSSSNSATSIRLTLTGPRNYLIVENGDRRDPGTMIRVRLNRERELSASQLTTEISNLCRRVEFPIFVDELGRITEIKAEQPSDFTFETEDAERKGGTFRMRAFPFRDNNSQGEIYILTRKDATGNEDWACRRWYEHEYGKIHPEADILPLVSSLVCLHGIQVNSPHADRPAVRQDVRGQLPLSLSRERRHAWADTAVTRGARDRLREILDEHLKHCTLAGGQDGWRYLNRLADQFPDMNFWAARGGMIPLYRSGVRLLASSQEIDDEPTLTEVTMSTLMALFRMRDRKVSVDATALSSIAAAVIDADLRRLFDGFCENIFRGRIPVNCKRVGDDNLAIEWNKGGTVAQPNDDWGTLAYRHRQIFACKIENPAIAALCPERLFHIGRIVLVNPDHEFGKWYLQVRSAFGGSSSKIERQRLDTLSDVIFEAAQFGHDRTETLRKNVVGWRSVAHLSNDLKPPDIEIGDALFGGHQSESKETSTQ